MENSSENSITATFLSAGESIGYKRAPIDSFGFTFVASGRDAWELFASTHSIDVLWRVIENVKSGVEPAACQNEGR